MGEEKEKVACMPYFDRVWQCFCDTDPCGPVLAEFRLCMHTKLSDPYDEAGNFTDKRGDPHAPVVFTPPDHIWEFRPLKESPPSPTTKK